MYATFAVFAYGFAIRMGWLLYRNLTLYTAHITTSSTGALLLTIPTRMRWAPGQHVILRFLAVRPLESHPFTVALPSGDGEEYQMRFMVLPRDGFTGALAKKVAKAGGSVSLRVLVDGPFGESGLTFRAYDSALLLAGGTGIAHVLPIFMDLVGQMKGEQSGRSLCSHIELVWVVRSVGTSDKLDLSRNPPNRTADATEWFAEDIKSAIATLTAEQVNVRIMATSDDSGGKEDDSIEDMKESDSQDDAVVDRAAIYVSYVRPDLASLIRSRSQEWSGRMAVACKPITTSSHAIASLISIQHAVPHRSPVTCATPRLPFSSASCLVRQGVTSYFSVLRCIVGRFASDVKKLGDWEKCTYIQLIRDQCSERLSLSLRRDIKKRSALD